MCQSNAVCGCSFFQSHSTSLWNQQTAETCGLDQRSWRSGVHLSLSLEQQSWRAWTDLIGAKRAILLDSGTVWIIFQLSSDHYPRTGALLLMNNLRCVSTLTSKRKKVILRSERRACRHTDLAFRFCMSSSRPVYEGHRSYWSPSWTASIPHASLSQLSWASIAHWMHCRDGWYCWLLHLQAAVR